MSFVKIYLLGSLHITADDETISFNRRKSGALLSYLAFSDTPLARDKVATLLWADYDQTRARAALRTSISELKSSPLGDYLEIDRETIALQPNANLWVDVHVFRELLKQVFDGKTQIRETLKAEHYAPLREAVDLYRDDFLAGFTLRDSPMFDEWQSYQTDQHHRDVVQALEQLVKGYITDKDYDQAIRYAQRWLSFEPFNESIHHNLMSLYAQTGQRVAALRQYEECVRLLEEEMGIEPHSQITDFYEEIKREEGSLYEISHDFSTDVTQLLPTMPTLTIGREAELENFRTRLEATAQATSNITIIQGWPGVGKSTFVSMLAHDSALVNQFPDGVLWTSLGEEPNLLTKLSAWGQALGTSDVANAKTLDEAIQLVQAMLRTKQMLLIVDDVWQTEHGMAFKIGKSASAMILTTRFNDIADALANTPDDVFKLSILDEDKSLELLRTLAPKVVHEHLEETQELVRDLEGLPLALQVAGRLLHAEAKMGWGVEDLLKELRDGTGLLHADAPADRADIATGMTPTIAVLLQSSIIRLAEEMQERFALLGVFAPKPATFDLDAMAAVWEVENPRLSARTLVDRGLLEPIGGGRFQMHALLVMHARSMFEQ